MGRPFHSFYHVSVRRGTGLLIMSWPLLFLIFFPIFQMKRLKSKVSDLKEGRASRALVHTAVSAASPKGKRKQQEKSERKGSAHEKR